MLLLYVYSIVLVVTICYNVVTICVYSRVLVVTIFVTMLLLLCLFNSFSCNYLLRMLLLYVYSIVLLQHNVKFL